MDIKEITKKLYADKKKLYIVLVLGIIILISSNLFSQNKESKNGNTADSNIEIDISQEEKRLEKILSKVNGAGKTKVMITYDIGAEKVVAQNTSITKNIGNIQADSTSGGEEKSTSEEKETVMSGSGSSQTPFVTKEIYPKVRGVVVVSEGADSIEVQYNLKNAVVAVLGVPHYRVEVLQMGN